MNFQILIKIAALIQDINLSSSETNHFLVICLKVCFRKMCIKRKVSFYASSYCKFYNKINARVP